MCALVLKVQEPRELKPRAVTGRARPRFLGSSSAFISGSVRTVRSWRACIEGPAMKQAVDEDKTEGSTQGTWASSR